MTGMTIRTYYRNLREANFEPRHLWAEVANAWRRECAFLWESAPVFRQGFGELMPAADLLDLFDALARRVVSQLASASAAGASDGAAEVARLVEQWAGDKLLGLLRCFLARRPRHALVSPAEYATFHTQIDGVACATGLLNAIAGLHATITSLAYRRQLIVQASGPLPASVLGSSGNTSNQSFLHTSPPSFRQTGPSEEAEEVEAVEREGHRSAPPAAAASTAASSSSPEDPRNDVDCCRHPAAVPPSTRAGQPLVLGLRTLLTCLEEAVGCLDEATNLFFLKESWKDLLVHLRLEVECCARAHEIDGSIVALQQLAVAAIKSLARVDGECELAVLQQLATIVASGVAVANSATPISTTGDGVFLVEGGTPGSSADAAVPTTPLQGSSPLSADAIAAETGAAQSRPRPQLQRSFCSSSTSVGVVASPSADQRSARLATMLLHATSIAAKVYRASLAHAKEAHSVLILSAFFSNTRRLTIATAKQLVKDSRHVDLFADVERLGVVPAQGRAGAEAVVVDVASVHSASDMGRPPRTSDEPSSPLARASSSVHGFAGLFSREPTDGATTPSHRSNNNPHNASYSSTSSAQLIRGRTRKAIGSIVRTSGNFVKRLTEVAVGGPGAPATAAAGAASSSVSRSETPVPPSNTDGCATPGGASSTAKLTVNTQLGELTPSQSVDEFRDIDSRHGASASQARDPRTVASPEVIHYFADVAADAGVLLPVRQAALVHLRAQMLCNRSYCAHESTNTLLLQLSPLFRLHDEGLSLSLLRVYETAYNDCKLLPSNDEIAPLATLIMSTRSVHVLCKALGVWHTVALQFVAVNEQVARAIATTTFAVLDSYVDAGCEELNRLFAHTAVENAAAGSAGHHTPFALSPLLAPPPLQSTNASFFSSTLHSHHGSVGGAHSASAPLTGMTPLKHHHNQAHIEQQQQTAVALSGPLAILKRETIERLSAIFADYLTMCTTNESGGGEGENEETQQGVDRLVNIVVDNISAPQRDAQQLGRWAIARAIRAGMTAKVAPVILQHLHDPGACSQPTLRVAALVGVLRRHVHDIRRFFDTDEFSELRALTRHAAECIGCSGDTCTDRRTASATCCLLLREVMLFLSAFAETATETGFDDFLEEAVSSIATRVAEAADEHLQLAAVQAAFDAATTLFSRTAGSSGGGGSGGDSAVGGGGGGGGGGIASSTPAPADALAFGVDLGVGTAPPAETAGPGEARQVVGCVTLPSRHYSAVKPAFLDVIPALEGAPFFPDVVSALVIVARRTGIIQSSKLLNWVIAGHCDPSLLLYLFIPPSDIFRLTVSLDSPQESMRVWAPLLLEAPTRSSVLVEVRGGVTVVVPSWPSTGTITIGAWLWYEHDAGANTSIDVPLLELAGHFELSMDDDAILFQHRVSALRRVINSDSIENTGAGQWMHFVVSMQLSGATQIFVNGRGVSTIISEHRIDPNVPCKLTVGLFREVSHCRARIGQIDVWGAALREADAEQVHAATNDSVPHLTPRDVPAAVHAAAMGSFLPHCHDGIEIRNGVPGSHTSAVIWGDSVPPPTSFVHFRLLFASRGGYDVLLALLRDAATPEELVSALALINAVVCDSDTTEATRPKFYAQVALHLKERPHLLSVKAGAHLIGFATTSPATQDPQRIPPALAIQNALVCEFILSDVELWVLAREEVQVFVMNNFANLFDLVANKAFARRNVSRFGTVKQLDRLLHSLVRCAFALSTATIRAAIQVTTNIIIASDFAPSLVQSYASLVAMLTPRPRARVAKRWDCVMEVPEFPLVSIELPLHTANMLVVSLLRELLRMMRRPGFAAVLGGILTIEWFVATINKHSHPEAVTLSMKLLSDLLQNGAVAGSAKFAASVAAASPALTRGLEAHCDLDELLMVLLAALLGKSSHLTIYVADSSKSVLHQLDELLGLAGARFEPRMELAPVFFSVLMNHLARLTSSSYRLTARDYGNMLMKPWLTRRWKRVIGAVKAIVLLTRPSVVGGKAAGAAVAGRTRESTTTTTDSSSRASASAAVQESAEFVLRMLRKTSTNAVTFGAFTGGTMQLMCLSTFARFIDEASLEIVPPTDLPDNLSAPAPASAGEGGKHTLLRHGSTLAGTARGGRAAAAPASAASAPPANPVPHARLGTAQDDPPTVAADSDRSEQSDGSDEDDIDDDERSEGDADTSPLYLQEIFELCAEEDASTETPSLPTLEQAATFILENEMEDLLKDLAGNFLQSVVAVSLTVPSSHRYGSCGELLFKLIYAAAQPRAIQLHLTKLFMHRVVAVVDLDLLTSARFDAALSSNITGFVRHVVDRFVAQALTLDQLAPFAKSIFAVCAEAARDPGKPTHEIAQATLNEVATQLGRVVIAQYGRTTMDIDVLLRALGLLKILMTPPWDCASFVAPLLRASFDLLTLMHPTTRPEADVRQWRQVALDSMRLLSRLYSQRSAVHTALSYRTLAGRQDIFSDFLALSGDTTTEFEVWLVDHDKLMRDVLNQAPKRALEKLKRSERKMVEGYNREITSFRVSIKGGDAIQMHEEMAQRHASRYASHIVELSLISNATLMWLRSRDTVTEVPKANARHYVDIYGNVVPFNAAAESVATNLAEAREGLATKDKRKQVLLDVGALEAATSEEFVTHLSLYIPSTIGPSPPYCGNAAAFASPEVARSLTASALTILRYMIAPNERALYLTNAFKIWGFDCTPVLLVLTNKMVKLFAFTQVTEGGDIVVLDGDATERDVAEPSLGDRWRPAGGGGSGSGASGGTSAKPRFTDPLALPAAGVSKLLKLGNNLFNMTINRSASRAKVLGSKFSRSIRHLNDNSPHKGLCWFYGLYAVKEARTRSFYHQDVALELLMELDRGPFLAILDRSFSMNTAARDALLAELRRCEGIRSRLTVVDEAVRLRQREVATNLWLSHQLNTFDYLMQLNTAAGRTVKDWNQYPVMPWVLADYSSPALELAPVVEQQQSSVPSAASDVVTTGIGSGSGGERRITASPATASSASGALFRDLSLPIGAQTADRRQELQERFDTLVDMMSATAQEDVPSDPPCHFSTHYSGCSTPLYYLVRLEPFTTMGAAFQGGQLDHADRLFRSVAETFRSCTTSGADCKELVPEFYVNSAFLQNMDGIDLGALQDGSPLQHVALPPWAQSPQLFVFAMRSALESAACGDALHSWIDLVFGFRQRGEPARMACNIYHALTYGEEVNSALKAASTSQQRDSIVQRVAYFGQTPRQLFAQPHPHRAPLSAAPLPTSGPASASLSTTTTPTTANVGVPLAPGPGSGGGASVGGGGAPLAPPVQPALQQAAGAGCTFAQRIIDGVSEFVVTEKRPNVPVAPLYGRGASIDQIIVTDTGVAASTRNCCLAGANYDRCVWVNPVTQHMTRHLARDGSYLGTVPFTPPCGSPITCSFIGTRETIAFIGTAIGSLYAVNVDQLHMHLQLRATLLGHHSPILAVVRCGRIGRLLTIAKDADDPPIVWRFMRRRTFMLFRVDLSRLFKRKEPTRCAAACFDDADGSVLAATKHHVALFDQGGQLCGAGSLPQGYGNITAIAAVFQASWTSRCAITGHSDGTVCVWAVTAKSIVQARPGALFQIQFVGCISTKAAAVTSLLVSGEHAQLYSGHADGTLRQLSLRTATLDEQRERAATAIGQRASSLE